MSATRGKTIVIISLLIASLVICVSLTGLFVPGFYKKESPNWQAQSVGQDIVNLFIVVPFLLCGAFLFRSNEKYYSIWAGTILYLIYTFIIYCFAIHFNPLFLVYCITLGACFFSALFFFKNSDLIRLPAPANKLTRITSLYFIVIGAVFFCLWLMGIFPAMLNNTVPEELEQTGLTTNPVHVLDLSIVLPGIIATGILVWRKQKTGMLLMPIILVFFILMDITIGFLALYLQYKGSGEGMPLALIMGILTLISLILLIAYLRAWKSALA